MRTQFKIIHFHPNGSMASIFVAPLIQAERKRGYESTLITSVKQLAGEGTVIPYDINFRNLPGIIFAFIKICIVLSGKRPNVVISHNAKSSFLPLLAARIVGVQCRVYYNHGVPFMGYHGLVRWVLKLFEILNCFLATEVVAVSPEMRRLLLGVNPTARISVIGHGSACGIDLDKYNATRYADSPFRQNHGISKNDLVVVFVGRPEKRKGFDLVLKLWCTHFKDTSYKLVLCGPDKTTVLKRIPNIPSNIICMGFIENVPEILAGADCLMLPSLHEGLPYAVLEAMACECVVVANDVSGIQSLVRDGVNGYLVSGNAISNYAEVIKAMKNRGDELADIRGRGLETVRQYSRVDFLPAYLEFIECAMGVSL
jgi:glycosyltransferase involved in cell wall biosynthesis